VLNLKFTLNGKPHAVECEAQETLAEVLRDRLNLNGTKVSCDVQVCGACTVLVDGAPVSACTYLAYEARGKNVTTIEGLEKPNGTLHPLQQAFIDEFAFQCGYCTPGMIMSAKALLDDNPKPRSSITWTAISAVAPVMCRSLLLSSAPRKRWRRRARSERRKENGLSHRQSFAAAPRRPG
jgi:carbon-monoxide dehydrogenase small subunit